MPSAPSRSSSRPSARGASAEERHRSPRGDPTSATMCRAAPGRRNLQRSRGGVRTGREEFLGGAEPGAELHRHAELLQGHLHAREATEQVKLVEAAEVADAEDLSLDGTEA